MRSRSNDPAAWLRKADNDLRAAQLALNEADPLAEIACYHAQQCAEKQLKDWLTLFGSAPPETPRSYCPDH